LAEKPLTVDQVAHLLGERQREPLVEIQRMLDRCGPDFVARLLAQTEALVGVGMWTNTRDRDRSKGGIFFALARNQMSVRERQFVFAESYKRHQADRSKSRSKKPQPGNKSKSKAPAPTTAEPTVRAPRAAVAPELAVARQHVNTLKARLAMTQPNDPKYRMLQKLLESAEEQQQALENQE